MDIEEFAEPLKAMLRHPWRPVLQNFVCFSSLMVAVFSLSALHRAGQDQAAGWIVLGGVVSGAIFAVLMYLTPRQGAP